VADKTDSRSGATPLWKAFAIGLFSSAWLGPLLGAASEVRAWLERDLPYRLAGRPPLDSAPHLDLAFRMLEFAMGWLSTVILFWTIHHLRTCTTERGPRFAK
jgi:hypothetical protein